MRGFVRDSLGLALSQYVARAVLLGRGLVAALALGPVGFGAWNALTLILDYGAYASLGAIQGLDLKLPGAAARGDLARAHRLMRGAWWVTLVGGALFVGAVTLQLAQGTWLSLGGWGWGVPVLMLAAALAQLAIQYHTATLRAYGDFTAVSVGLTLQAVVGGGLGLVAVWRWGIWGLAGTWLFGSLCAVAWMRRSPHRPPLWPRHAGEGVALGVSGLPMFLFFGLALVIRSLDRIALVRFAGNDALGLYSIGLIAAGTVLYLPEAAAAVLFPRVAAAADGARDPEATRIEVSRAHRSLAVLLPPLVALGVLWAPPVLANLLPEFAAGLPALRVLAVAALVLSTATLPAYYLLGMGHARSLLVWAAGAALVAAISIFTMAAIRPTPTAIAWAATAGYGAFALAMTLRAAPLLAPTARERLAFLAGTYGPMVWGALLLLGLSRVADPTLTGAAWRSAAFLVFFAPFAFVFGRGIGLGRVLREIRAAR